MDVVDFIEVVPLSVGQAATRERRDKTVAGFFG